MVPLEQGRRRISEEQLTRTSRRGGSSWSKTCSRSCRPPRPGSLHDPALRSLLESERKRLKPMVEQALGAGEIREAFKELKRPLYPYQREGVERFLAAGRLLLADDMGLGKTAQAIACCDILAAQRPHPPRPDHRAGQPQAPVGSRMGGLLRPADPCRRRHSRGTPGRLRQHARKGSSSSITSNCCATSRSSAAGTPTWSCSTRRSGSRTGRPRPRSRSRD